MTTDHNRHLTREMAIKVCPSPHLCLEFCVKEGDYVICPPCSIALEQDDTAEPGMHIETDI